MKFESAVIFNTATVNNISLSPSDSLIQSKQLELKNISDIQAERITVASTVLDNVVTKSTDQVITAQKNFANVIVDNLFVEKDIDINGFINKVDASEIKSQCLFINVNATLPNHITFANDAIINSHVYSSTVNNISTSDLITIDKSDEIHGEKIFMTYVDFSSDLNEDLLVEGLVNGINLTNVITVNSNQTVTASYKINGKSTFNAYFNVEGHVNNLDLSEVAADTLLLNEINQLITSHKTFNAIEINGDLKMKDGAEVNGVDISELMKFSQLVKYYENLSEAVVFYGNVSFNGVNLNGQLHGMNLSELLYTYLPANVSGKISFATDVYLQKNTAVDGKVNGIDISGKIQVFKFFPC